MSQAPREVVAILDAGAQYGKVIDRKVRELKVETDLLPLETPAETLRQGNYRGIIISGGPNSVYSADAPQYDAAFLDLGIPIFGICYGMQLCNLHFGGTVLRKDAREDGQDDVTVDPESALFQGMESRQTVLLTHGDSVGNVAPGFRATAHSGEIVAAIEDAQRAIFGVQFHPEVDLSVHGQQMFSNFLFGVCKLSGTFTIADREEECLKEIRSIVKDKKILVLVSGGVDSSVCAALVTRAVGAERVIALHIDNGFMRARESALVHDSLAPLGLNLRTIDASAEFYNGVTQIKRRDGTQYSAGPLKEVVSPEDKRKIIGDTFMRVTETQTNALNLRAEDVFVAQGTLRPDLIESASALASGKADAIKTHHNDTELVRALRAQGRVIEPLKDYHKDEVRELGKLLGLPDELVMRQPFPGPGLAVRVLCTERPYVTEEFDATNERIGHLLGGAEDASGEALERIKSALGSHDTLEAVREAGKGLVGTLLPVQTVGVQGDGRTYSYVCTLALRADDGSASCMPHWPHVMLLAKLIPKICHNVNRVAFMWGGQARQTGGAVRRVTETHMIPPVLDQLRQADSVVNALLLKHNLVTSLSQVPVVSVPVDVDSQGTSPDGVDPEMTGLRCIAIRTFITADFMTGVPAVPGRQIPEDVLAAMVSGLRESVPRLSRVLYDCTSKPPGTTEWE